MSNLPVKKSGICWTHKLNLKHENSVMFLLFLSLCVYVCINQSPVRKKLLQAEGSLTAIRKKTRSCVQWPYPLEAVGLCSENKALRKESSDILFCSGMSARSRSHGKEHVILFWSSSEQNNTFEYHVCCHFYREIIKHFLAIQTVSPFALNFRWTESFPSFLFTFHIVNHQLHSCLLLFSSTLIGLAGSIISL